MIGIDQPALLFMRGPMFAGNRKLAREFGRGPLNHRERRGLLMRNDRGHAGLQDAGFLARDIGERRTEIFRVVDRDRRDHGGERPLDHIGRIETSAEAGFEKEEIGGVCGENREGGGGRDLEKRDRIVAVQALAFAEHGGKCRIVDQDAAARAA